MKQMIIKFSSSIRVPLNVCLNKLFYAQVPSPKYLRLQRIEMNHLVKFSLISYLSKNKKKT